MSSTAAPAVAPARLPPVPPPHSRRSARGIVRHRSAPRPFLERRAPTPQPPNARQHAALAAAVLARLSRLADGWWGAPESADTHHVTTILACMRRDWLACPDIRARDAVAVITDAGRAALQMVEAAITKATPGMSVAVSPRQVAPHGRAD